MTIDPFWPAAPLLLAFIAASLVVNVAPGLDMVFVIGHALKGGWRIGRWAALGIAGGSLCHAVLAAVGVSTVLAAAPGAMAFLTYAGALYLVYVGVGMARSTLVLRPPVRISVMAPTTKAGDPDPATPPTRPLRVFRDGVLTNLFNVKVVLFYLTFLPQFVRPERAPGWQQMLFLGLLFNTLGTLVLLAVAWLSGWAAGMLDARPLAITALSRAAGVVLIVLTVVLAWSRWRH